MKDIKVEVTTKHFREASNANNIFDCPLYNALLEVIEEMFSFCVSSNVIIIGDLLDRNCREIIKFKNWSESESIDDWVYKMNYLIARAKAGEEIETHIVTLLDCPEDILKPEILEKNEN